MRKILTIIFICALLTSCVNTDDFLSELDDVFASAGSDEVIRTNNYSAYVNYYLPSDTQEFSNDYLSHTFIYNNSKIIMDINVSGIINSKYYTDYLITNEGFFDENKLFYYYEGVYRNIADKDIKFFYRVYRHNNEYLGYFVSEEVIFYTYTNNEDLLPVSSRILLMAKGLAVNREDIISNYSSKEVVDYQKKQVNLFETIMPVNGVVNEFLLEPIKSEDNE